MRDFRIHITVGEDQVGQVLAELSALKLHVDFEVIEHHRKQQQRASRTKNGAVLSRRLAKNRASSKANGARFYAGSHLPAMFSPRLQQLKSQGEPLRISEVRSTLVGNKLSPSSTHYACKVLISHGLIKMIDKGLYEVL